MATTVAITETTDTDAVDETTVEIKADNDELSESFGSNNTNIISEPASEKSNIQLDFEGLLLAPLLCEIVSSFRCTELGELAADRQMRHCRASSLRARQVGSIYTGLSWLPSLQPVQSGQYVTDPDTGECKTQ